VNSAESLQPLINSSIPKVGEGGETNFPDNIFLHLILHLTTVVHSIFP
jgi:hypothetical protein